MSDHNTTSGLLSETKKKGREHSAVHHIVKCSTTQKKFVQTDIQLKLGLYRIFIIFARRSIDSFGNFNFLPQQHLVFFFHNSRAADQKFIKFVTS